MPERPGGKDVQSSVQAMHSSKSATCQNCPSRSKHQACDSIKHRGESRSGVIQHPGCLTACCVQDRDGLMRLRSIINRMQRRMGVSRDDPAAGASEAPAPDANAPATGDNRTPSLVAEAAVGSRHVCSSVLSLTACPAAISCIAARAAGFALPAVTPRSLEASRP